ncbi:UNVERIFIED_CONTAM: hypothetical protein HDU68_010914 [Siphonaria sp. JEL0065]|nr:hypothetical protein HDU68_010914 [Siphonaria sp. JEL0065]
MIIAPTTLRLLGLLLIPCIQAQKLTYSEENGPVIPNVEVIPIYYGNHPFQTELNRFYSDIVTSRYYDTLQQYDTHLQQIRRGKLGSPITHANPQRTMHINIVEYLQALWKAGVIMPTENTYYPIHMGPEINHETGGCAVHGSVKLGDRQWIVYAVLPYQSTSKCVGKDILASIEQSSSHELIESVTNPAENQMAWNNHGLEVGDMCNGRTSTITVDNRIHTVHQIWSNLGFIGLGQMGFPMAVNLMKKTEANFVVYDDVSVTAARFATVADALKTSTQSIAVAKTPRDLTVQCDLIVSMLPGSAAVQDAYLNKETGIVAAMSGRNRSLLLIDSSTLEGSSFKQIATDIGKSGAFMLDAPVSLAGDTTQAEAGNLTFLVGAHSAEFYNGLQEAVFSFMGKSIHCGGRGTGQMALNLNNFLVKFLTESISNVLESVESDVPKLEHSRIVSVIRTVLTDSIGVKTDTSGLEVREKEIYDQVYNLTTVLIEEATKKYATADLDAKVLAKVSHAVIEDLLQSSKLLTL